MNFIVFFFNKNEVLKNLDVVTPSYNPNTWKAEAGGLSLEGQPRAI